MSDDAGYVLDREAFELLTEMARAYRSSRLSTLQRPVPQEEQGNAPEVYVARTPAGGIPGRVGDVPGSADCTVYRLLPDAAGVLTLTDVGLPAKTVYNLATAAVGGGEYVETRRDKWGTWWAGSGGAGGISPTCPPVTFEETDLRCEADTGTGGGSLNLYRRSVLVSWADGCPSQLVLPWSFVRAVACCDPSCATDQPDADCDGCAADLPPGLCLNVYPSPECPCWEGVGFPITYGGGGVVAWQGGEYLPGCGELVSVFGQFGCAGGSGGASLFSLEFNGGGGPRTFFSDVATQSCDPLYAKFRVPMTAAVNLTGCADTSGYLDVVVTAPPCSAGTGTGTGDGPGTGGTCPAVAERGLGGITNTGLAGFPATLSGVTVNAGELLVVSVGQLGALDNTPPDPLSVKFNGVTLTQDKAVNDAGNEWCGIYSLLVGSTTTGDVVATPGTKATYIGLVAVAVTGVTAAQVSSSQSNSVSSVPTLPPVSNAGCGYVQGAFVANSASLSWAGDLGDGGFDQVMAGWTLYEGFRLVGPSVVPSVAKLNSAVTKWAGCCVEYE